MLAKAYTARADGGQATALARILFGGPGPLLGARREQAQAEAREAVSPALIDSVSPLKEEGEL
jgi:hypothetical protein